MQGVDEKTEKFHRKGNMAAVFGDIAFKEWVYEALMPELAAKGNSKEPCRFSQLHYSSKTRQKK